MLSPRFIPKSVLFSQSTQTTPVPTVHDGRRSAFIKKRRTSGLFTNTTLNRLGFGATASGDFNFQNNESEVTFEHQSSPVGAKAISSLLRKLFHKKIWF